MLHDEGITKFHVKTSPVKQTWQHVNFSDFHWPKALELVQLDTMKPKETSEQAR